MAQYASEEDSLKVQIDILKEAIDCPINSIFKAE